MARKNKQKKKKNRDRREKHESTHVEVRTSNGNFTTFKDRLAYVIVDKNHYVIKRICDLNKGDKAFILREFKDMTLEELEPYMEMFPDYTEAKNKLFVTNNQGVEIPRFRIDLMFAIAPSVISQDNLLEKILKISTDFTPEEYSDIADHILEYTEKKAAENGRKSVCRDTILSWLKGEVKYPLKENLEQLAGLDDTLTQIYQEFDTKSGVYKPCTYYRTVRQNIQKRLKNMQQQAKDRALGKTPKVDTKSVVTDMPVVNGVIEHLLPDIDSQHILAEVLGTKSTKKPKEEKKDALYTGFPRQAPAETGLEQRSMQDILEQIVILDIALTTGFHKYVRATAPELSKSPTFTGSPIFQSISLKHDQFVDEVTYREELAKQRLKQQGTPIIRENGEIIEEISDRIYQAMIQGTIDRAFKIKPGTFKRTYDIIIRDKKALPKVYFLHSWNLNMVMIYETSDIELYRKGGVIGKKTTKEDLKREAKKQEKILHEHYNMYTDRMHTIPQFNLSNYPDFRTNYEKLCNDIDLYVTAVLGPEPHTLMEEKEVCELFEKHEVDGMMHFISPLNFEAIEKAREFRQEYPELFEQEGSEAGANKYMELHKPTPLHRSLKFGDFKRET